MTTTTSRPRGRRTSTTRSRPLLTSVAAVFLLCLLVTGPASAISADTTAPAGNDTPGEYRTLETNATGADPTPSVASPRDAGASNPETRETVSANRSLLVSGDTDVTVASAPERPGGVDEASTSAGTGASDKSMQIRRSSIGTPAPVYPGALLLVSGLLGLFLVSSRFSLRSVVRLFRSNDDGTLAEQSPQGVEPDTDDATRCDEAVVRQLLERHDGQMPQSDIVAATDWSKAKVSRLLGDMADEGEIVKIPLGRQNLVCLDGMEPEIVKPPA